MAKEQDNPKRWRHKFSVRTLVILVTLVCCYAACWGPTKSRGLTDVENHVYWGGQSPRGQGRLYGANTSASLPLIIGTDESGENTRGYYFWLFGLVLKLPFEHSVPVDEDHWGYVMKVGQTTKSEVQFRFGSPDVIVSDTEWVYDKVGTFRFDDQGRIAQLAE